MAVHLQPMLPYTTVVAVPNNAVLSLALITTQHCRNTYMWWLITQVDSCHHPCLASHFYLANKKTWIVVWREVHTLSIGTSYQTNNQFIKHVKVTIIVNISLQNQSESSQGHNMLTRKWWYCMYSPLRHSKHVKKASSPQQSHFLRQGATTSSALKCRWYTAEC